MLRIWMFLPNQSIQLSYSLLYDSEAWNQYFLIEVTIYNHNMVQKDQGKDEVILQLFYHNHSNYEGYYKPSQQLYS